MADGESVHRDDETRSATTRGRPERPRRSRHREILVAVLSLMVIPGLIVLLLNAESIRAFVDRASSRWDCAHAGGALWDSQIDGSYRPLGGATGFVELSGDYALDRDGHLGVVRSDSEEVELVPGINRGVEVIGLDSWGPSTSRQTYVLLADGAVVGVDTNRGVLPILGAGDRTSMGVIGDQLYVLDSEGTVWLVPLASRIDGAASLTPTGDPRPVQGLAGVHSLGVLNPLPGTMILAVLLDGSVVVWPYDDDFIDADIARPVPVPGVAGATAMAQSIFGGSPWDGGRGGRLVGVVIDGFGTPSFIVRSAAGEIWTDDRGAFPGAAQGLGRVGAMNAQVLDEDGALRWFDDSPDRAVRVWRSDPYLDGVTAIEPQRGHRVICGAP